MFDDSEMLNSAYVRSIPFFDILKISANAFYHMFAFYDALKI